MKRLLPLLLLALPPGCGQDAGTPAPAPAAAPVSAPTLSADSGGGEDSARIEVEKFMIDLGEIIQGQDREVRYPFEVEGKGAVTISRLAPSCGCTEPRLLVEGKAWEMDAPIPAGSHGEVVALFRSGRFHGHKSSNVRVLGTGGNLPLTLQLTSLIRQLFELQPQNMSFGEVSQGKKATLTVDVDGVEPFSILGWEELPKGIEVVDPVPAGELKKTHTLQVSLLPEVPIGSLRASLQAHTSLGGDLVLLVQAEVLGPLRIEPARRLNFGAVDEGRGKTLPVVVYSMKEGTPISPPGLSLEGDPAFHLGASEVGADGRFHLPVILDPHAAVGRHDAVLVLSFAEETGMPETRIPVNVYVRKPRTFQLEPSLVRLPDSMTGQGASGEVDVAALKPFEIQTWTQVPDNYRIEALDGGRQEADGRYHARFRIHLDSAVDEGLYSGQFLAATSLGESLRIPVSARVEGPVRLEPSSVVSFGAVAPGTAPLRLVKIRVLDPSITLTRPQLEVQDPASFQAKLRETASDGPFEIEIRPAPGLGEGIHSSALVVHFPGNPELKDKSLRLLAVVNSSR